MAQTVMTPPEQENKTSEQRGSNWIPNLGPDPIIEDNNIFKSLWQSLRDVFFPEKLPPLQLESRPIPVVDRMATQRDPKSTTVAVVVHFLLLLLIFFIGRKVVQVVAPKPKNVTLVDPNMTPPVKLPPAATQRGGGGGAHDIAPVTQGRIPPISKNPIVPPSNPPKIQPKLEIPPAINMQPIQMQQPNLPNFGDPHAPHVGVASMGNGSGGGIGGGKGNGLGSGEGGNTGGGVYRIGEGGVSAPVVIHQEDPEFSEEARKAKYQGTVLVNMVVDANGHPTRIKVIRPLGMGLDEKAIQAASKYVFKPARKNGQPVPVEINVEVVFQIF